MDKIKKELVGQILRLLAIIEDETNQPIIEQIRGLLYELIN